MDPWFNSSVLGRNDNNLKNTMRKLWEQHITWTRLTIISIIFNLPDVNFVTARLLRNATDMGNSLKPFYGNKIAAIYTELIREHLVIAAELVKAAKAEDQMAVADAERRWYENGEQIAYFLNAINPFISEREFKKMFFEHLTLTKSEAVFILQEEYQSSIDVYDEIEAGALQMADTISNGIIMQFANRFRRYSK